LSIATTAEDHARAAELQNLGALDASSLIVCYRDLSASYYAAERQVAHLEATISTLTAALQSVDEYSLALERLRRHRRTMRENNRCPEGSPSSEQPCWLDLREGSIEIEEMCDRCLMRQAAYPFRVQAMKDVVRLRGKIEREARKRLAKIPKEKTA
jgi:hypothetical protein